MIRPVFAFQLFFFGKSILCFFNGSRALFMGPTNLFLAKFSLKMGPMALFTHLKIILLPYFQFLAK